MKKCYVYMVALKGFIKIGHAANPEARLKQMQTGSPWELKIVALLPFPSKKAARDYELELHHRLRSFRVRGEWFRKSCLKLAHKEPHKEGENTRKKTKKDERWVTAGIGGD